MVDEADKDGTGLLTEKEFMQSSATEVWSDNAYRFITCLTIKIKPASFGYMEI